MLASWPYSSASELLVASERSFDALDPGDWREAFAAHPRIGDLGALHLRPETSASLERAEQAGAAAADEATLEALARGNRAYEERFGHVFLICASGRSAGEMLAALERRMAHDPGAELEVAAEEQRKITALRLQKLLREPHREIDREAR
jgi:2-oxo-4-hydroxy-4-carboxy-5-ureidoimidazoline decarboxylase